MGYRSDVRIVTSKKGFKELKKFTDNYLKEKNYTYGNLLDDCQVISENKWSKYFGWDSIKWYEYCDDYEDVSAIMEGLKHLEKNDMSYRYARIGESYDDYEEFSYESENEKEQDLEYPSMVRYFDDEWVKENMHQFDKEEEL